jgi:hypothetical protein
MLSYLSSTTVTNLHMFNICLQHLQLCSSSGVSSASLNGSTAYPRGLPGKSTTECQCGCLPAGSDGSAWDSWLKGAFQSALAAAPLDMAEAWATAVRFAVNALAYTNPAGMHAVLQVIIQQPPQGKLLCRGAAHTCVCWYVGCTGLLKQQCGVVHAVEPAVL